MIKKQTEARSMARQFARNYLVASIVTLIFLIILMIVGLVLTQDYLEDLIMKSAHDLNMDAEKGLQELGEEIIQSKARDVSKQLEVYFRTHPNVDIREMRRDPFFMGLALQKVGKTGYTAVYETNIPIFRIHPNKKLIDQDVSFLAKDLPSWWAIVKATLSGKEISGYYNWRDTDGSVRKKYMTITPVKVPLSGKTMMVAATTYIDEFSVPIIEMEKKAKRVIDTYQEYVTRLLIIFGIIVIAVIILTFFGTYSLGRRTASLYIIPIMRLAARAHEFGEGKWDATGDEATLERKDEIGTLFQAFNRMSQQLKDLFGRLEQQVTELKLTQDALKESEEHYRSLFDGDTHGAVPHIPGRHDP
jgi:HAMP domain-containing protein